MLSNFHPDRKLDYSVLDTGDHTLDKPKAEVDSPDQNLISVSADCRLLGQALGRIRSFECHQTKTNLGNYSHARFNARDVMVSRESRLSQPLGLDDLHSDMRN